VSVPVLVEELWGEDPPPSSRTTLQTYVMRLRRRIDAAGGRAAKDVLVHQLGGYRLAIGSDDLDAGRFDRAAAAGQRAFDSGDHVAAARVLRGALDMWQGEALADVPVGPVLAMEVTRLEESRLGVLETRIEADLRSGRHRALVSELAVLRSRYPMHESFCVAQMLALYRCGRQWQALDAYLALRTTLVTELGVEPSPRVQRLHALVLDSDPSLELLAAPLRMAV
jgi:DNA-binding SARP family transcriptional activator